MEDKELTPEQRKEIIAILRKGRLALPLIAIKFSIGLFAANLATLSIGKYMLADQGPDGQAAFHFICIIVNLYFMSGFLNRQINANSDIVSTRIKEVLKK
jgi:hypothetical protein